MSNTISRKKRGVVLSVFLCLCLGINAQETRKWSLEECIQHAIDHNISLKQIELQKENAKIKLNTSQMSRLPNLNAGVDQRWSFGRAEIENGTHAKTTSISNTSLSVNSSIPLFTGFRITNEIARDKLDLQAASANLEKARESLSLNVASLFLQVLFNKEIVKINEDQWAMSRLQIERTRKLVDAEKVPLSQLYDMEAQVAKDEVSVVQAQNSLNLALLDLAQSLELEREASFDIFAPELNNVIEEYAGSIRPPHIIFNNVVGIRPAIKEQEYRVESAEKTLKIAQSGYYPTLNLSLGYGTSYYYNYDFDNVSFSKQFRDKAGEYIGLNLSIPVFNRFSVRNNVRSSRINMQNQQLVLEDSKKNLYKEIQTAYSNAIAAQEKIKASGKAVKASAESFKYAQKKYETGKSSVFEFNEARTRMLQSQSEEIQAKYEYVFRTKILDFYNGEAIKL